MFKKSAFIILVCLFTIFTLAGCHHRHDANTIKVGVIAGPESDLMEVAKQVAKQQYGLNVDIVEFNNYIMPNEALADDSIDANMFQTIAYLADAMKAKGYQFAVVGNTFIYPMGLYSKKIRKLSELKNNSIVAIPNDPSNEARALLLLQQAGLINIKPGVSVNATPNDIVANPKHLQIKELDAAELPRALSDVDLAAINTNYASLADLLPSRDALVMEGINSPYANVLVVRAQDKNQKKYQQLLNALHSHDVLVAAKKLFKGNAIPAWQDK